MVLSASLSGQLGDTDLAPVGKHCILELSGCPRSLLDDAEFIKQSLQAAAQVARSTLLGEIVHKFNPQGVTAIALLAESHISVHTWPERGYAAIDVFTCGEHTKPEESCRFLIQALQASGHNFQTLRRCLADAELAQHKSDPALCLAQ
ncbi:MAG: adenosylmethionine decarboxylase [Cyanobacteria bacterium P01_H01_bin.121]